MSIKYFQSSGVIFDGQQLYFIEPDIKSLDGEHFLMSKHSDAIKSASPIGNLSCGVRSSNSHSILNHKVFICIIS